MAIVPALLELVKHVSGECVKRSFARQRLIESRECVGDCVCWQWGSHERISVGFGCLLVRALLWCGAMTVRDERLVQFIVLSQSPRVVLTLVFITSTLNHSDT